MNGDKSLYFTIKKAGKAIWDYGMLREGDKVLLAVSGGKDSLSMLRIMKERKKFVPVKHDIIACHVDMGFPWADSKALETHFDREDVPYVVAQPPPEWKGTDEPFNCFWCSWNRRKALFELAQAIGCTKIAFAHHMDDIIETMLLNLFFQGEIGTMQPYQDMFDGKLAIIRPLAYVEEKELARLAARLSFPVITSQCPHDDTSKRRMIKGVIEEMKKHSRHVKKNIFRSLKRVRSDYLLPHTGE